MTADPNTAAALDSLLAEEAWARRLARALVGEADADDLVQEALLQVTRGRVAPPTSPRAWFATVLRNGAASLARERSRRRIREQRVARQERLDETPALLTAQLEQRRVLAELLLECPEELRTPLMLHHEQGLGWAAIARRLGIGETTAKSRAGRGLEWMRARIEDPSRHRSLAGLGVLLVEPRALAATAAAGAGLAFSKGGWAAAALVVLGLGLGVRLLDAPGGGAGAPLEPLAASPLAAGAEERTPAGPVAPPRESARAQRGAAAGPDLEAAPEVLPAVDPERLILLARLVDEDDQPLAGVEFRTSSATTRSDANGRVELATALPEDAERQRWVAETHDLVHASGSVRGSARGTFDLGTLRLLPSGLVRGRLLETDGTPAQLSIGAAPLAPTPNAGGARMIPSWTKPEEDGRFELRLRAFEPSGLVFHDRESDDLRYGAEFLPRAGEVIELGDIVIAPPAGPRKLVLAFFDAAGEPVRAGGLRVAEEHQGWSSGGVGEARLEYRLGADEGPLRIEVRDESGRLGARYEGRVEAALPELRLVLDELPILGVRVRDPDGEPVPGADVVLHRLDRSGKRDFVNTLAMQRREMPDDPAGSAGRGTGALPAAFLHELRAFGGPFELEVAAPGFATLALGPFGRVPAAPIEAQLVPLPRVAGRVLAGGEPLAGALVELHAAPLDRQDFARGVPLAFLAESLAETRTDGEGRFELPAPAAQRIAVLARSAGLGEQWVLLEGAQQDVELRLEVPGRIEGRLRTAPGDAGTRLAGRHVALARGGLDARSAEVDAEGRFEFEAVAPGAWTVAPIATPLPSPLQSDTGVAGGDRARLLPNVTVRPGATARVELELFEPGLLRVHGSATLDGQSAAGWRAEANASTEWPTPEWNGPPAVQLDEQGRFTVEAPRGLPFRLRLSGRSGEVPLTALRPLPSQDSDELWLEPLEIVTGTIEAPTGAEPGSLWIEGELEGGWSWHAWVGIGAARRFTGVPAGLLRVGTGYEGPQEPLATLELEAGGELRLP